MADKRQYDPGPTDLPGTGDQDQERGATPGGAGAGNEVGGGLSGGVTDIDRRDGEADDSNSGYSDEDLMRTGGGATEGQTAGNSDVASGGSGSTSWGGGMVTHERSQGTDAKPSRGDA
jgi:hypothetical protein